MAGYRPALLGMGALGLLCAGGAACSGPAWRFEAPEPTLTTPAPSAVPPDWVLTPAAGINERERIAAVGVGADAAEAQERALTRLAQSLSVRIQAIEIAREASTRSSTSEAGADGSARSAQRSMAARLTRSRVDLALLGARIDAMWTDAATGRVYARALAPRELAVEGLTQRAQAQAAASAEWLALARLPSATALDRLRRLSRTSRAAQAAAEALAAARAAAAPRADLRADVERARGAMEAQGITPPMRVEALVREAREACRVALRVDAFTPPGLEITLRAGLARLGLAVVARAPAAVEIALTHEAFALGSDADGQQRVGWRVSIEARDAASGASAGARTLEGTAAGPSHAEALATAAIAARRSLRETVDDFLRQALLGERDESGTAAFLRGE